MAPAFVLDEDDFESGEPLFEVGLDGIAPVRLLLSVEDCFGSPPDPPCGDGVGPVEDVGLEGAFGVAFVRLLVTAGGDGELSTRLLCGVIVGANLGVIVPVGPGFGSPAACLRC